ncbi:penicillin-binding protein activator [bacterium]|nr:penicillin-binding protein activator [bacterium]
MLKKFPGIKSFLLSFLLFFLAGCGAGGGGGRPAPEYSGKVNAVVQDSFAVGDTLYKKHEYDAALNALLEFIKTFPHNRLTDEALYKTGKIYILKKDYSNANNQLNSLITLSPDPEYRAKAQLLRAQAYSLAGDDLSSLEAIKKCTLADLPTRMQIQYFSLFITTAKKLKVQQDKIDYAYLRLLDLYQDSSDRDLEALSQEGIVTKIMASQMVNLWVNSATPLDQIADWMKAYPRGYARPYVDFKIAKIYFDAKNTKAKNKLEDFVSGYPRHELAERAKKMLAILAGAKTSMLGGGLKIGVVLPLSGSLAPFGEAALRGIKCAAGLTPECLPLVNPVTSALGSIDLVIRDSGTSVDQMDGILSEMASLNVSAVIGPMSSQQAMAGARKANELKMVLLPITQKDGLMRDNPYVFQMGYDTFHQIDSLVTQALNRGYKTFGIFYPQNNYGREMQLSFENRVKDGGGKIIAKAGYNPTSSDYSDAIRELKLSSSTADPSRSVAFDALFIPDSFSAINRIVPQLRNASINNVVLFGGSAWNDDSLSAQNFDVFPQSFYVDLFSNNRTSDFVSQVSSAFSTANAHKPTSVEALGFDAAWFVMNAAKNIEDTTGEMIRNELASQRNLSGLTTIRSFESSQGATVEPLVFLPTPQGINLSQ